MWCPYFFWFVTVYPFSSCDKKEWKNALEKKWSNGWPWLGERGGGKNYRHWPINGTGFANTNKTAEKLKSFWEMGRFNKNQFKLYVIWWRHKNGGSCLHGELKERGRKATYNILHSPPQKKCRKINTFFYRAWCQPLQSTISLLPNANKNPGTGPFVEPIWSGHEKTPLSFLPPPKAKRQYIFNLSTGNRVSTNWASPLPSLLFYPGTYCIKQEEKDTRGNN